MSRQVARCLLCFALLSSLLLCAAAYFPGLHGGFVFDDWQNIVHNSLLQVDHPSLEGLRQAAFSVNAGPLKRPVSMLSFWLNYYFTGLDPFAFKLTNLLIHLLNGVGLFWLTKLLLETSVLRKSSVLEKVSPSYLALAVAAIWLVHPLNLTAVLYVVQRMTSLSATFVILGVLSYVLGRRRLARGATGFPLILFGLFGWGALAVLSKENGALLPFFMGVIEVTLFRFSDLRVKDAKRLKLFFVLTVVVPVVAGVVFLLSHSGWLLRGYEHRDFTLGQRLMTEARVLWLYLRWAIVPTPNALGLYHDDIPVSTGLLHPATTLPSIIGIVLVCAGAIRFRKRAPVFAFATFWYLAGHLIESSIIPLELVFEHRNYLPIYGPLLAGVYGLMWAASHVSARARYAAPIAFVLCFAAVTANRAAEWGSYDGLRNALVRHHPDSPRANYDAGTVLGNIGLRDHKFARAHYRRIKTYFERSASLDETAVNGLFGMILLDASSGRPIDGPTVDRLAARLGRVPLGLTVIGAFRSLVNCIRQGKVDVPRPTVVRLFEAALGNPTTSHQTRAALLSELSVYYVDVSHDLQSGASLAVAAVKEDPGEPALHLSLAGLAMKLGNTDLAVRELDRARRTDTLGRFVLRERALAKDVQQAQARNRPAGRLNGGSTKTLEARR